jgi:hypothetical protein
MMLVILAKRQKNAVIVVIPQVPCSQNDGVVQSLLDLTSHPFTCIGPPILKNFIIKVWSQHLQAKFLQHGEPHLAGKDT